VVYVGRIIFNDASPYANRIKIMWLDFRKVILEKFRTAPGMPKNIEKFISSVKEIYVTDAYHSLSIERYQVTPERMQERF
jgi:hypothetical protein